MAKYCFGVDIGGTTVKLGLFNIDGALVDKWEIVTRKEEGGRNILPDVAAAILGKMQEKGIAKEDVEGVGIGTPGPVDTNGVVSVAVNLGWGRVDLKAEMEALLGVKVQGANDANVAALGEMWQGGGKGCKNLVLVTLGTGVGGGIIVDGKIVAGATGSGGEIGHVHAIDNETEKCNCGNKGCLEQYVSATGIVRMAKAKLAETDRDSVLRKGEVSAKSVFDGEKAGDALCVEIAEEFGEILGKTLSVIAGVTNPEVIVIGGGVSKAGTTLLNYIKKPYREYAFSGCADAEFTLATLGNDAGIYGAAKLVLG